MNNWPLPAISLFFYNSKGTHTPVSYTHLTLPTNREVFIGTLATIYSVGSDDQETIKNRMAGELKRDGTKLFNLATGISLMLFYAFAMQCMSTLAIVKKETNSWKWPIIQLLSMTVIAYLAALISFQLLK